MLQVRSMFFCFNQNGWSYSNPCRLHLLFALSKEGASRNIEGIDRYRYESRHETIRVAPRLPKGCQKKAPTHQYRSGACKRLVSATPTLSRSFAVTSFQPIPVGSSIIAVLPPNLAA